MTIYVLTVSDYDWQAIDLFTDKELAVNTARELYEGADADANMSATTTIAVDEYTGDGKLERNPDQLFFRRVGK